MELDDLQKTWKTLHAPTIEKNLDTQVLRNMLQTRSKGVLERLRINSLLEFRLNALCAFLLFVGIVIEDSFVMRVLFGVFLLYEGLLGYYFYRKLHLLHTFASPDESLKSYFTKLNKELRKFLRIYKYGNALLMPPAFLAGLFMGTYYNSRGFVAQWLAQSASNFLLVVTVLTIIASILGYAFISLWTNRFYGVHLKRLEEYTKELED